MPKVVRNFFIQADIDGKKAGISTGPRGSNGGFDMTIYIRNEGEVEKALEIRGIVVGDRLSITVEDEFGNRLARATNRDKPTRINVRNMTPIERVAHEASET